MKTGKALKCMFIALCLGTLVSCGSDNKSDSGNVTSSAPQATPNAVVVNISGEGRYRTASNLNEVKYNILNGHFVRSNNNSSYEYDEYDYSCSVSTSQSDFLWWEDAINVSRTSCGNNATQYFERSESNAGVIVSAYGTAKLQILNELYAIANTAQSAKVSMNYYGENTIARIYKGSKMYIIDFGQPISANPVAEYDSSNGNVQGYQLRSSVSN